MTTVTIPKEFQKEKRLVALPPRFYEDFLAMQRKIKTVKTFKPTARDLRMLAEGRANFKKGNFVELKDL